MAADNDYFAHLMLANFGRLEFEEFQEEDAFLNNVGIDEFACPLPEDGGELMKSAMDGLPDFSSSMEHGGNNEASANVLPSSKAAHETSFDDYLNALSEDPTKTPVFEKDIYEAGLSDQARFNDRNPIAASLARSHSAPESFLLSSRINMLLIDDEMASMPLEEEEEETLDSLLTIHTNETNSLANEDVLASVPLSLTRGSESNFAPASTQQAFTLKRMPSFNVASSLPSEMPVNANCPSSCITTNTRELLRPVPLSRGASSTMSDDMMNSAVPSPTSTLDGSDLNKILGHADYSNVRFHMDAQQLPRALSSLIDYFGISLSLPDSGHGNVQSAVRYPPIQRSQSSHVLGQFRSRNGLHTHLEDMPTGGLAANLESFGTHHQEFGLSDTIESPSSSVLPVLGSGELQVYHGAISGHCAESDFERYSRADIGHYTSEERKIRLHRYRQKRSERNFNKKIKYACRKTLADSRQRIRGRFARTTEDSQERPPTNKNGCAHDHYERIVGSGSIWGHQALKS